MILQYRLGLAYHCVPATNLRLASRSHVQEDTPLHLTRDLNMARLFVDNNANVLAENQVRTCRVHRIVTAPFFGTHSPAMD